VRKRISQSLTPNVETVLSFEEQPGAVGGVWAVNRYTPSSPGTYLIVASVRTNSDNAIATLFLRKNGAMMHAGSGKSGTTSNLLLAASTVSCNGTTDYVEVSVISNIAQPLLYDGGAHQFFGLRLS
jgi:hypothetical protein